jgi:hypothetical protein
MSAAAPDYVEPVVGWRLWHALESSGSWRLWSLFQSTSWPQRKPLVAECRRLRLAIWPFSRSAHEAPQERCRCGIYATSLEELELVPPHQIVLPCAHPVIGTVSLWGRVVECERGWRASRGYPERLYVPVLELDIARATHVAFELAAYGVPVHVLDAATLDDALIEAAAAVS